MYGFSDHLKGMPFTRLQGAPARLLAVVGPHDAMIEHVFA